MGLRRLASKANPRIREWAGLDDKTRRRETGLTLAEGARLAREGMTAPPGGLFAPVAFLVADAAAESAEAGSLFRLAGELGIERFSLSDDCGDKVSSLKNSDGFALVMSYAPRPAAVAPLFAGTDARWLVAVGVQDPGNAGALARTALAVGASGCLFLDGADPASPKFLRGSMGAAFRLPCLSMPLAEFVATWKDAGARLVAAEASGGEDFRRIDYRPPLAIAVGGEKGIAPEVLALADARAAIPLRGGVESLNLAVAAGVILFEAETHWQAPRS